MSTPKAPIFVAITADGAELAKRLANDIRRSQVHGLEGRVTNADLPFQSVGDHLRQLYNDGQTIVGIFSTGIMIRMLTDCLTSKQDGPAVLCLAEDGSSVVPLLGGHHGANDLARTLANLLGIQPSITTGGDTHFGIALDNPPSGWKCSDPSFAKPVMAAMLADQPVCLHNDLTPAVDIGWLTESSVKFSATGTPTIHLTEASPASDDTFTLHPATLVMGIGCERGVTSDEILALATNTLAQAKLSANSVACISTIELKEDETGILDLATAFDVPVQLFTAEQLEAETARLANPSDIVFNAVGCHGVAEAAALAGTGTDGTLTVAKQKSARATCAIARAPAIVRANEIGRAVGSLTIVGMGPGDAAWRSPEATNVISAASDLVGYRLYLDLLGDLTRSATLHPYDLGQERDRCAEALSLASTGKQVALISSGDAGIYAMASLVYELIDRGDRPEWQRLNIRVVPGISALQAAAARSGAPLGHDFCTISLSDLLTPWETIEQRLQAAAQGDFVIALYNPVSKKRTEQLMLARSILLIARAPETPVIIARNLGRDDEAVTYTTLEDLHSDQVDMLTLVMIGSSQTRLIGDETQRQWVYTPRGYEKKEPTT
ncbi:MAG: precorrin-3B C(17)-methyltransferase [Alphaproteobacteria bacterium]|nr:precorrin-3B C(17)-methyltransferase [Alphaproteobacteria bacterium]